jgi:opacity protein-like surface antigen
MAPSLQPLSGFYIGGFGGWGSSNDFQIRQSGIALFSTTLHQKGIGGLSDPLAIDAVGDSDHLSIGFGGIHVGYEWAMSLYNDTTWNIIPAIELEGIYFRKTAETQLDNSSFTALAEHDFDDKFPFKTGVVLVNGIFELNCLRMQMLHPYIGVGLGAAVIAIKHADSLQVSPPEPGVNHFNSDQDSQDWTFAAQAKVGLRYAFSDHLRMFAEYRFIYLGNTEYTFGSTQYPTHVPTTSWKVDFHNMYYSAGALGIEYTV